MAATRFVHPLSGRDIDLEPCALFLQTSTRSLGQLVIRTLLRLVRFRKHLFYVVVCRIRSLLSCFLPCFCTTVRRCVRNIQNTQACLSDSMATPKGVITVALILFVWSLSTYLVRCWVKRRAWAPDDSVVSVALVSIATTWCPVY